MSATSQRVQSRKVDLSARPATRTAGQPVTWSAPDGAPRRMPARWLNELLVLALTGLLLGAAALYGLASVSARLSTPTSSTADCRLRSDHVAAARTFGGWDDPPFCLETW